MNKEKQSNQSDKYSETLQNQATVRWGGTGAVAIIYYLADSRILDYVTFFWRTVSDRPGLTAPTSFRTVPLSLLPHLERAQSSGREVFVDFCTDAQGGSAEVITIATLSSTATVSSTNSK